MGDHSTGVQFAGAYCIEHRPGLLVTEIRGGGVEPQVRRIATDTNGAQREPFNSVRTRTLEQRCPAVGRRR